MSESSAELDVDVKRLGEMLAQTVEAREGSQALRLVEQIRHAALALRAGELDGGRAAFAARIEALDLPPLELLARSTTLLFHLLNSAEEQHRIRVLRHRDRNETPPDGSVAQLATELGRQRVPADEVRALLDRLFVMPVLTAHPTEARRRTVLDHLADIAAGLDRVDDPRTGARGAVHVLDELREAISALYCTEEARRVRPSPTDEVRAGLQVFSRTLLDVTPQIYRELEDALGRAYPGECFVVKPFLRYGSWIGGDRDGNPHVTAEVTRAALELQRRLAVGRLVRDAEALGREISVSARRVPPAPSLLQSIAEDRARLPEVAARARRYEAEPWREKLWYVRARLQAARDRGDGAYADAQAYRDDLLLLDGTLDAPGLAPLRNGRLRDARRRAEVFGFHLATLDLRQHSAVHEAAVAELLQAGGVADYARLDENARLSLLGSLLDRADVGAPRDRAQLSPATRELLATLDVAGRARRDVGPEACQRYVVSFTRSASDMLEVLFLARAARLAPDEIRPVPLLEQLEDLERAAPLADAMLAQPAMRGAVGGELEVMVGYSDSSKQAGYVSSHVALAQAQEELARVADGHGVVLTIFHGRGGAIGRGGGPAGRAIRAQPARALRGRLRVTEQGETVATRYGRLEIARRDLEQMVSAVVLASLSPPSATPDEERARAAVVSRASAAARAEYHKLVADDEKLIRYALAATPIQEIAELPIASRPAARRAQLTLDDLRAIPWVFSWAQSRHGLPGWYGLGTALQAAIASEGLQRVQALYRQWPFFCALVDNAQVGLVRSDIDVAREYARLADDDARQLFALIEAEHARTVENVLRVTGEREVLAALPTIAATVQRRNPFVDVLSHTQIALLKRLRAAAGDEREQIRRLLFVTINGIAAGLQTAG